MLLDVGSCRVAGEAVEHGGCKNGLGNGLLYEVRGGGEVANILHVGSG